MSLPKESSKPKKSNKKIIIIIVSVILIGIFVISPIVSYITDPEYREGLEELSEPKLTYEELLIEEWSIRVQECEAIDSLEKFEDLSKEIMPMDTLIYELNEYVKSPSAEDKILSNINKVGDCMTKKEKEFK